MAGDLWRRRDVLVAAGSIAAILGAGSHPAWAQAVKWSEGTEKPKLQAPPNA
ncbi:MAG: 2-pyrone-4,6-dicarboxylate hydrolase, partial [Alphaproteobacteria bacterium]|nr:2-pyrone-4,6-dicarboxylate hydrolase [Alphaproteobacteria bacterium]